MTDAAHRAAVPAAPLSRVSAAAARRTANRYRTEAIFKGVGLGALLLATAFLVLFLYTIVKEGFPAFFQNYATIEVELKREEFDPQNTRDPKTIGAGNFDAAVRDAVYALFPGVTERAERRALSNVLSSGAPVLLRREVLENPAWIGGRQSVRLPVDDMVDLYLKGVITATSRTAGVGELSISGQRGQVELSSTSNAFAAIVLAAREQTARRLAAARVDAAGRQRVVAQQEQRLAELQLQLASAEAAAKGGIEAQLGELQRGIEAARAELGTSNQRIAELEARSNASGQRETLDRNLPSFFARVNGGYIKLTSVSADKAQGQTILQPSSTTAAAAGVWEVFQVATPEANRRIGDRELIYAQSLKDRSLVESGISRQLFFGGASREPELAGVGVAIIGSIITLMVTLGLAFPIGVAAAIYLEEFAPKNRWTEIIEVNINNLAAVPSIIFGLLGLAIFLNWFGLPRSAPIVGGMVLALMTLPIIIIASRAAIRAVPPSVKEAALGVGASHQQAVFHHVLPLAMPGILTGTILGMAHALGETAPLLMIGMVAFVVDYPKGVTDAATLLPVQIFMWADFPELAFQQKTAAAIIILLVFLIFMNLLAILLRKRFERRW
jgi:phosphate transport system permease protein